MSHANWNIVQKLSSFIWTKANNTIVVQVLDAYKAQI